jgi:hypothetical protein
MARPNYTYFPVRSDIAIDDYDEDGYSRFFDPEREIDIETARRLRNEGDRFQGRTSNYLRGFRTRAPPPVLLYVCRESSQVACKYYERVFGTKTTFPEVWFNFEIDTLYLDWGWPRENPNVFYYDGWFVAAELERVQYLALYNQESTMRNHQYECEEELLAVSLKAFPNAKKVTLNGLRPCHTIADSGTLVFTNPASPDMRFYVRDPKYFSNQVVGSQLHYVCVTSLKVDPHLLEKWRLEEYNVPNASLLPPLPEFDYRMITTPHIKAELTKAEAQWRKEMTALAPFGPPRLGHVTE